MLSKKGAGEPGRLRLRLTLEKPTPVPDGLGGATMEWDAVATLAAEVSPLKGEERSVGEGLVDTTRHRIVVRCRDDVSPGDRFRLGARVFTIRSVTDPAEDRRWLVCIADEEGSS